jgi:hypothetical protein
LLTQTASGRWPGQTTVKLTDNALPVQVLAPCHIR